MVLTVPRDSFTEPRLPLFFLHTRMGRRQKTMQNTIKITLIAIAMILSSLLVDASVPVWVSTKGPEGGVVYSIAIDPVNTSILYAATYGRGIFKSTDSGKSWHESGQGINHQVSVITIDPNATQTLYAGLDQWIDKSTDGGNTWNNASVGLGFGFVEAIVVDPSNSNTVYAAMTTGVYKTTNAGTQWNLVNTGLTNTTVHALVMNPQDSAELMAGTPAGVFKTTNGAASWNPQNTGLSDPVVTCLAYDPLLPSTIYAGTSSALFRSTNGAGSWSFAGFAGIPAQVFTIAFKPQSPSVILVGTTLGIRRTINSGSSWTWVNAGISDRVSVYSLVFDPIQDGLVYSGSYGPGVLTSNDDGAAWSFASKGMNASVVRDFATEPAHFHAGTSGGAPTSFDSGKSWTPVAQAQTPEDSIRSIALDPQNSSATYVATQNGVYKTTNGWSWSQVGLNGIDVNQIAIDPTSTSTIYAGTLDGMFKTTNGTSWSGADTGLINTSVYSVAMDPALTSRIYAGTAGGVFLSTNGAGSWGYIGPANAVVTALYQDPATSLTLYVAVGTKLYRTTNGGGNWTLLNTFSSGVKAFTISTSGMIASTYSGAYSSVDNGQTWQDASAGLPKPTNNYGKVIALKTNPYNPQEVLAGTEGFGAYRLVNAYFWDNFSDMNASDWTLNGGNGNASAQSFTVTTTKKVTVDSPTYTPCYLCALDLDMVLGTPNEKLSIYGWYKDSKNYLLIMFDEKSNKIKISEKENGTSRWKSKINVDLSTNVLYHLSLKYDGANLTFELNGVQLLNASTTMPIGTQVSFRLKSTGGVTSGTTIDNVLVY